MSARAAHRVPVALLALALVACGAPGPSLSDAPRTGGTLRVALVGDAEWVAGGTYWDPAFFWSFNPLFRCCLVRTLLSYNGRPTEEGGAELRPDLAVALPDISADGLTWTFHLKPGIHYAPPLEDRTVEARDFVTGFEHALRYGEPLLEGIVGVTEFLEGTADTIAGLETPDSLTLVVRLDAPAGDLGNRLATSPAAPLPAEALAGREDADYNGFLVASGPYMYEGADSLRLDDPEALSIWAGREDGPVALVRNPSWDPATDPLRAALVDRIEAVFVESPEAAAELVESGAADIMGEPAPLATAERFLADPELRDRVFTQAAARVHYMAMNLALPPFDDIHVRRAVNFAIDRASVATAMQEARQQLASPAHHLIPDMLENNLLLGYAPYGSGGDDGDLEAAREEMRASAYDADGDGSCDAEVCAALSAGFDPGLTTVYDVVAANLRQIGIELEPTELDVFDPRNRVASAVAIGWGADVPHAANFAFLFQGPGRDPSGLTNLSLLGAAPDQLADWGYQITDVPALDGRVDPCLSAVGSDGFQCWAELDQLLMERVVALAPLGFGTNAWIVSERVAAFSPDSNGVGPAIDQIQLNADPD